MVLWLLYTNAGGLPFEDVFRRFGGVLVFTMSAKVAALGVALAVRRSDLRPGAP